MTRLRPLPSSLRRRRQASCIKVGRIEPHRPAVLMHLRGEQASMGEQHGEVLREIGGWEAIIEYFPGFIDRMLRGSGANPLERALPTALRPAFELGLRRLEAARPPALRARSRSFMRALGEDMGQTRHLQVMDAFQNIVGTFGRLRLGPFMEKVAMRIPPACSSLALWGDASASGRLLHARNFDFPGVGVWERAPVVVMCSPHEGLRYGFVSTRGADTPGVTAFNEAGLCLTVHTRWHPAVHFDGISVVDLGHEIVRRASTLEEALAVIRERRIASTWGLLISSAAERDAMLVEVHAQRVRVTRPQADQNYSVSTNHYLHPEMQEGELHLSPGWSMHTGGRFQTLERHARASSKTGGLSVEDLQALLGSHHDPDLPGAERAIGGVLAQATSIKSVVFDLENQSLHLSVGDAPTGHGPWIRVPLSWDETPGYRLLETPDGVARARQEPQTQNQNQGAETSGGHAQRGQSRYHHGAGKRGLDHFVQAGRLEAAAGPPEAIRAHIEAAIQADPADPSWRFLHAGLHLRAGEMAQALEELELTLTLERSPFYRGQALLWASRAAQVCGEKRRASALRDELLKMKHPWLSRHHKLAQIELKRPWNKSQLRHATAHIQLADIGT